MDELLKVLSDNAGLVITGVVVVVVLVAAKALGYAEFDIAGWKAKQKQGSPSADQPDAERTPAPVVPTAEPPAPAAASEVERERDQLREALYWYNEGATSLDALMECDGNVADEVARNWFASLATIVAWALRTSTMERYRVSMWRSGEDPDNFDAVGLGMFEANDTRMAKLGRTATIGGEAFTAAAGEKYCPNVRDPACGWRPRTNPNPPYASMFAVRIGEPPDAWGVVTVDCNVPDGFSEADKQVVRHFAELAMLGALSWRLKVSPRRTATSGTT